MLNEKLKNNEKIEFNPGHPRKTIRKLIRKAKEKAG